MPDLGPVRRATLCSKESRAIIKEGRRKITVHWPHKTTPSSIRFTTTMGTPRNWSYLTRETQEFITRLNEQWAPIGKPSHPLQVLAAQDVEAQIREED
jgi:hypothetical protein